MSYISYDHLFIVSLLGDSGVGKSAVVKSFVDDIFVDNVVITPFSDLRVKTIKLNNKVIALQIWDNCEPIHHATGNLLIRGQSISNVHRSQGILLLFDVTDENSFNNVHLWLKECDRYAREDVIIMIIGCKCDKVKKRVVQYSTAKNYVESLNFTYFECSSKYSIDISDIFSKIALEMLKQRENTQNPIVNNNSVKIKKGKGCASKIQ